MTSSPPLDKDFARLVSSMTRRSSWGGSSVTPYSVNRTTYLGAEEVLAVYRRPLERYGRRDDPYEFFVFIASCLRHEYVAWGGRFDQPAKQLASGVYRWHSVTEAEWNEFGAGHSGMAGLYGEPVQWTAEGRFVRCYRSDDDLHNQSRFCETTKEFVGLVYVSTA